MKRNLICCVSRRRPSLFLGFLAPAAAGDSPLEVVGFQRAHRRLLPTAPRRPPPPASPTTAACCISRRGHEPMRSAGGGSLVLVELPPRGIPSKTCRASVRASGLPSRILR